MRQHSDQQDAFLLAATQRELGIIEHWTKISNRQARGKLSEALDLVHQGLEKHPDNPYLLVQNAQILLDQNNPLQAENVYDYLLEVLNRIDGVSAPDDTLQTAVDCLAHKINSTGSRVNHAPQYGIQNGQIQGEHSEATQHLNHLEV
ncbi:MAG: tetratricopeptide repeat protein [Alphaproteobacteria bacterium]|nr:tetratricopeptide repeat protein [Alphaproteobacteria bacterium]